MLDKKDAQWWVLEAEQHPERATDLIRMLAERMAFLDARNEELRGEVIELRRKGRGANMAPAANLGALQQRVEELETRLKDGGAARHLLIHDGNRLFANVSLQTAQIDGVGELPKGARMLVMSSAARLYAITADTRVFSVPVSELPQGETVTLDAPKDIATFIDQSIFESSRYLVLVTRGGTLVSTLAGNLARFAAKGEKILRNMLPDDPIIAAYPSGNADLLLVSRLGRWLRFPERALGSTGTQGMTLPKDDALAGLVWVTDEAPLYLVTASGRLFMRHTRDLPAKKAPGRATGQLFSGQEIIAIGKGTELLTVTPEGGLSLLSLTSVPARAETDAGYTLPGISALAAATFI